MSENNEKNNIFVVEKILNVRKRKGQKQYLIKWEGYSDEDNTWEWEDNMFCKDMIAEFEAEYKNRKKSSNKRVKTKNVDKNVENSEDAKEEKTMYEVSNEEDKNSENEQTNGNGDDFNFRPRRKASLSTLYDNDSQENSTIVSARINSKEKTKVKEKDSPRRIPNKYDKIVDKVVGVRYSNKHGLQIFVRYKNNRIELLSKSEAHMNLPLHLLEFYENNMVFSDEN